MRAILEMNNECVEAITNNTNQLARVSCVDIVNSVPRDHRFRGRRSPVSRESESENAGGGKIRRGNPPE